MAKRTTTQIKKAPDQPQRICGDCGLGTWVDSFNNMDWQGKPICLTCPNRQFHILRGAKACEKWIPKPIKEKED